MLDGRCTMGVRCADDTPDHMLPREREIEVLVALSRHQTGRRAGVSIFKLRDKEIKACKGNNNTKEASGYLGAKLGVCSGSRLGGGARALTLHTVHRTLSVQAANSGGGANADSSWCDGASTAAPTSTRDRPTAQCAATFHQSVSSSGGATTISHCHRSSHSRQLLCTSATQHARSTPLQAAPTSERCT